MDIKNISSIYKIHETRISSFALFGGFIFDILTLRRADTFFENFWIIFYLSLATTTILWLSIKRSGEEGRRLSFWLFNILQFSFGGLLSAFLILYFRSAALSVSWPFLLLLLVTFLANERLKSRYERLTYQISFLFLVIFLFLIFFVPVLTKTVGPIIFLVSGLLSLVIIRIFIFVLSRINKDNLSLLMKNLRLSILSIFVVLNVFYFTNVIPPIPLSLKQGGVYHSVDREVNGDYVLKREKRGFRDYFQLYPEISVLSEQSVYAYTAIFSPAKFNIKVVHDWQFLNEDTGKWQRVSRVELPISGGREKGYRTYSFVNVSDGRWRVNVLTEDGQVIGRIKFDVRVVGTPPELIQEVY